MQIEREKDGGREIERKGWKEKEREREMEEEGRGDEIVD